MLAVKASVVLIALAALTAGPAHAADGFAYGDVIMLPRVTVDPQDPDRLARCDYIMRGDDSRMTFGYVVPIPAKFADGTYAFRVFDGLMGLNFTDVLLGTAADFDVTFVPALGTCDAGPPSPTRFFTDGEEEGIVPAGTRYAIFTAADRVGATFVIEIGDPWS